MDHSGPRVHSFLRLLPQSHVFLGVSAASPRFITMFLSSFLILHTLTSLQPLLYQPSSASSCSSLLLTQLSIVNLFYISSITISVECLVFSVECYLCQFYHVTEMVGQKRVGLTVFPQYLRRRHQTQ